MSNQAVTWAYKQQVEPSAAKFLLVTLANYAGADGHCHPGQERLAEDTCQSVRAVRGHLAALERAGLIERTKRYRKDGTRTSDEFLMVGFTLPADSAGSHESLPADNVVTTGRFRTTLPAESAGYLNVSEPSVEPSVEPLGIAAAPRKRDPIWDTLVTQHGFSPTPKTPEHGRWNKAAGIYRQAGITPETIPRVYDLYRAEYRGMDANALAVASRAEHLLHKGRAVPASEPPAWVPYAQRKGAD